MRPITSPCTGPVVRRCRGPISRTRSSASRHVPMRASTVARDGAWCEVAHAGYTDEEAFGFSLMKACSCARTSSSEIPRRRGAFPTPPAAVTSCGQVSPVFRRRVGQAGLPSRRAHCAYALEVSRSLPAAARASRTCWTGSSSWGGASQSRGASTSVIQAGSASLVPAMTSSAVERISFHPRFRRVRTRAPDGASERRAAHSSYLRKVGPPSDALTAEMTAAQRSSDVWRRLRTTLSRCSIPAAVRAAFQPPKRFVTV